MEELFSSPLYNELDNRLFRARTVIISGEINQKLAELYTSYEISRFMGYRIRTAASKGVAPGPEVSVMKIAVSDPTNVQTIAELRLATRYALEVHIAPPEDIEKYRGTYDRGWQAIRKARHKRMMELGVIDESVPMAPTDMPMTPAGLPSIFTSK